MIAAAIHRLGNKILTSNLCCENSAMFCHLKVKSTILPYRPYVYNRGNDLVEQFINDRRWTPSGATSISESRQDEEDTRRRGVEAIRSWRIRDGFRAQRLWAGVEAFVTYSHTGNSGISMGRYLRRHTASGCCRLLIRMPPLSRPWTLNLWSWAPGGPRVGGRERVQGSNIDNVNQLLIQTVEFHSVLCCYWQ